MVSAKLAAWLLSSMLIDEEFQHSGDLRGAYWSIDRGQEMFDGMLTSIGLEKAFGGFW